MKKTIADLYVPPYKFNEDKLLEEFKEYVNKTYAGHYSKNSFQASEFIIDCGHGMGFFMGNVLKLSLIHISEPTRPY